MRVAVLVVVAAGLARAQQVQVHWMVDKGEVVGVNATYSEKLTTFCTKPAVPSPGLLWASAALQLSLPGDSYSWVAGPDPASVAAQHADRSLLGRAVASVLPWRGKAFRLDPFQSSCVGIATKEEFQMRLEWLHVNYYLVLTTLGGLFLFHSAPRLCRSTAVHYSTAVGLGASLSLLLLVWLLQSRVRGTLGLPGLAAAYLGSLYGVTAGWLGLPGLLRDHLHWVLGYLLLAGALAAGALYRLGPPAHPRTLHLLQWALQAAGLAAVALSSHHTLYSVSLALALLLWAAVPSWAKARASTQVRRNLWRPRVKLLTEEEYRDQATVTTRRALEELRRYCRSPANQPWQMVPRLASPNRFAEFVEGSPHLTEQEVMQYSTWSSEDSEESDRDQLTDDDSEGGAAGGLPDSSLDEQE